jgi:clan AA aspartic protease (TIGR02281 family)
MRRCISAAAAATIGLTLAGSVAAAESKCKVARIAEWPLRAEYYRPVFDGAINGQKIGILIDTGADSSLVRLSAATRLGLTRYKAPGRRVVTISGESQAEFVHIDEFRIGQGVRKHWEVLVAGEQGFRDSDVAVLLGDDFFQQVDVEFDLAHNAVRLYETRDCEGMSLAYWATEPAGEVPIEAGSSIRFMVAINSQPIRAQLDSGASASVLSKADAARLAVTPESPGTVAGSCITDGDSKRTLESWVGQFESFAIGNEKIRNPRIRFADLWKHMTYTETGSRLPTRFTGEPDLLLGVDFLRAHRVLVARSQRKMYFTYAGGTVFPSKPSKGCNQPSSGGSSAGPPKQGEK